MLKRGRERAQVLLRQIFETASLHRQMFVSRLLSSVVRFPSRIQTLDLSGVAAVAAAHTCIDRYSDGRDGICK